MLCICKCTYPRSDRSRSIAFIDVCITPTCYLSAAFQEKSRDACNPSSALLGSLSHGCTCFSRYCLGTDSARPLSFPDKTQSDGYTPTPNASERGKSEGRTGVLRYPASPVAKKKNGIAATPQRSDRIVGQAARLALPGSAVSPTVGPPPLPHLPLPVPPNASHPLLVRRDNPRRTIRVLRTRPLPKKLTSQPHLTPFRAFFPSRPSS